MHIFLKLIDKIRITLLTCRHSCREPHRKYQVLFFCIRSCIFVVNRQSLSSPWSAPSPPWTPWQAYRWSVMRKCVLVCTLPWWVGITRYREQQKAYSWYKDWEDHRIRMERNRSCIFHINGRWWLGARTLCPGSPSGRRSWPGLQLCIFF